MPNFYAKSEINIDSSEYWSKCSNWEKEELTEFAIEEGYAQANGSVSANDLFKSSTYTENELAKLLIDIWESRNWFSIKEIDVLRQQLRDAKKI